MLWHLTGQAPMELAPFCFVATVER